MEAFEYTTVIELLDDPLPTTAVQWRMLGMALLRSGRLLEAETPLSRASTLNDPEGQVEYGNFLRSAGRFQDAVAHFERVYPGLSGELAYRCLRWWGTTEFQKGEVGQGIAHCEEAWRGYLTLGNTELIGRVTQTLAQMHLGVSNRVRARQMFREALRYSENNPDVAARVAALQGVADLCVDAGELEEADGYITEALRLLDGAGPELIISKANMLSLRSEYFAATEQVTEQLAMLEEVRLILLAVPDYELRVWTASRLADLYSRQGKHGKAIEALHELSPTADLPPALRATRGILMRRRGHMPLAIRDIQTALPDLKAKDFPVLIRSQLHLAEAMRRNGEESGAVNILRETLILTTQNGHPRANKADFRELRELTQFALLDPETATYMEMVLSQLDLCVTAGAGAQVLQRIQVETFGHVSVMMNGEQVPLALEGSALALAYLTLHPNRTRAEIQAALYPEKEPETGASYFRSVFRELRQRFGEHVLKTEGPHKQTRYRLYESVYVELDVNEFWEALRQGDVTKALVVYQGAFLKDFRGSPWADETRQALLSSLKLEVRRLLDQAVAAGDSRRELLLCNQYLRIEPLDLDMLQRRNGLLQVTGTAPM